MKRLKNKKTLAIAGGILGVVAIGGVIAYNQDLISFANIFGLDSYETVFTEVFDAPTNWQPCEEVTKTFTVTNNNSYPVAVRFKLNEYWRTSNTSYPSTNHEDSDLSLTFNKGGTQSPIAVINPSSDASDWELGADGWYYYKTDLAANSTTSSYLESVMIDCDFNMVGSVTYSQDGKTGESQPNDYANSTYHIFITGQTIPAEHKDDWRPAPHTANCQDPNNDLLYDKIACATNGNDASITYDSTQSTTSANGFGVNTLASSVNDQFPTYYYRGNVTDNNVLWSDQCWKILRTTDTGGVKMIWMGEATNGQCQSTDASQGIAVGSGGFNSFWSYASGSYTYGSSSADFQADQRINSSTTLYFSNDVAYSNGTYTLTDTDVYGTSAANAAAIRDDHHYTCLNGNTSCSEVAYIWYTGTASGTWPNTWPGYIIFRNGMTVETFADTVLAGTNDSNAKYEIDDWFTTNIASARRSDLEDTPFCNDRSLAGSSLRGKDSDTPDIFYNEDYTFGTNYSSVVFGALARSSTNTVNLGCPNTRDVHTVANGKLDYPVALITFDEVRLTGKMASDSNTSYDFLHDYGNNDLYTYTMSPAGFDREDGIRILDIGGGFSYVDNAVDFNPVVSLKFGAKYSGSGTASDPYTISF